MAELFLFQQVVIVVDSKTRTEVEHVGFKVVYRWMGAKSWFYMSSVQNPSMRRLHFKGDALGLAVRPSIPKADLTMRLVDKYVTALKGARGLNLPLPDIVEVPIISDPSYAELDTQSRYRAYWRFQNRGE